jgi:23S rRNA (cytosine1962-C5)-methyltransferase
MSDAHVLKLKPKHDRRIAEGHPWVFSNEIEGDVAAIPPGGVVDVIDTRGKFLGRGYGNPQSLIAARILTKGRREDINHPAFFAQRLREAASLRELTYPGRRSLRLVFSEADRLPGLVIDRYDDTLAVQITTLGMEQRKEQIAEALQTVFAPAGAVLRNEMPVRRLEGLELHRDTWFGSPRDEVEIDEQGVRFLVGISAGQKTGHFFDQADNKRFAASLCRGRNVLDIYANTGGWALHALVHGATHATTVDSDGDNVARTVTNAKLNGVADRLLAIEGEGKRTLQALVAEGRRFGAVVLDPPAFAKQRKAAGSALRGYREINALGMTLLEDGGLLFTSSCSFHVLEERFLEALQEAARDASRRLVLIHRGAQAMDHPVLPQVPETRYLKSFAFRVHMNA